MHFKNAQDVFSNKNRGKEAQMHFGFTGPKRRQGVFKNRSYSEGIHLGREVTCTELWELTSGTLFGDWW